MVKPSKSNVTGVESFDHSAVKRLPEYAKACQALDELVHALDKQDIEVSQTEWLKMVEQMTASLPYTDSSGHKPREACEATYDFIWPYKTRIRGNGLECFYFCQKCQLEWSCWYAINAPDYFP